MAQIEVISIIYIGLIQGYHRGHIGLLYGFYRVLKDYIRSYPKWMTEQRV